MSKDQSNAAAELDRLALISHSGSSLAQFGPQCGRIVAEMVRGALALSRTVETGTTKASAPQSYKSRIPPERISGFVALASRLVAREGDQKVITPELVARFIDEALPGGKARAMSDNLWSAVRMANPSLPAGEVDWQAIYAELDAQEVNRNASA